MFHPSKARKGIFILLFSLSLLGVKVSATSSDSESDELGSRLVCSDEELDEQKPTSGASYDKDAGDPGWDAESIESNEGSDGKKPTSNGISYDKDASGIEYEYYGKIFLPLFMLIGVAYCTADIWGPKLGQCLQRMLAYIRQHLPDRAVAYLKKSSS